jgi:ERCC4-type nuclease
MAYDKKTFLKKVVIVCDTREQENNHIIKEFDRMDINYISQALDFGDYSFKIDDKDFTLSCVVERKANINEFYGNITQDRERIEKEFNCANSIANQFVLLIENCCSFDGLNAYEISDFEMKKYNRKIKNIGEYCYSTIQSWQSSNRYNFKTLFVKDNKITAIKILEVFYWYWRNYKILTANRRNRKKGG